MGGQVNEWINEWSDRQVYISLSTKIYGIDKGLFGWIDKCRNSYTDKWKTILYLNCVLFHA